MLIAIPSKAPGGPDAAIAKNFDHCAAFTIADIDDNVVGDFTILENSSRDQKESREQVKLLTENRVDILISGDMDEQTLADCLAAGIMVFYCESASDVKGAVDLFVASKCRVFGPEMARSDGVLGADHPSDPNSVQDGLAVTIEYEIRNSTGQLIDTSLKSGPMRYLHGSGMIMAALEEALSGLEKGTHTTVRVDATDAYGERDESRILTVPRSQLPVDITIGTMVSAHDQKNRQISLTVSSLDDEFARLDGNHPLAGMDLVFEITVSEIATPTAEELAHGLRNTGDLC